MDKSQKVYEIVKAIPRGKVLTYGAIAKMARVKSPRLVGKILHQNPDPKNIPCHRVVNSRGRCADNYAFGGKSVQIRKLKIEGVAFNNSKVDLKKSLLEQPKPTS
jgi:methylated-DNA-protein-cysteine methyltransferase-like protein